MENPHEFQLQKLPTGEVTSCDINPNYTLAIGSSDKKVRVLEWKTGLGFVDLFYSPLNYHKYGVTAVRFSPKGTILASSSLDGTAVLIDVFSGTKIFTTVQHNTSNIKFCEFTFDCLKLITAADDGVICFWDLVHHSQIRHFRLHEDDYSLRGVAISPDSEYLLSIDSGNLLKLWVVDDVVSHEPECLLLKKNIHDDVLCCDFSPVKNITGGEILKLGYRIVTCGADNLLKIWDVTVKKDCNRRTECDLILFRFLKQDNNIFNVRFSAEGNYLVTTGLDSFVRLWEAHTGNCLEVLQGHTRFVTCAAFSKDSILMATGSIDRTLIIWDLSRKLTLDSDLLAPCKISCHFTCVDTIKYSTRKKRAIETKKYNEFNVLQKIIFSSAVNSVMFQGDDILAVAGGNKTLAVWRKEGENYEEKELLTEHEYSINHLDISSCGRKIISSSMDGIMIFWDLNMNLTYKMKTPNCTGSIRICKFSPDSKFIAAGGDDQNVYLWDANNLEFMKILQSHENAITGVAFTPDGEFLVSSCCGSEIILQNLKQNKLTTKIQNAHDLGVLCCDFSSAILEPDCMHNSNTPDQKLNLLATGGNDSLVKLWKVSTSEIQLFKVLFGHGGAVNYVRFSPTEPFVLASCSSDATVRIWDAKTEDCLHALNCHQNVVTTCSFSKDSSLLATGSLDKTVLILNLAERSYHEPNDQDTYSNKLLEKWTSSDVVNWFSDVGCPEIANKIHAVKLTGENLLNINEESIPDLLGLAGEKEWKEFKHKVLILKKSLSFPRDLQCRDKKVPHKFLCPITHQIMREPVICSDGYTYDRQALTEWFLGGKIISPVTKECLTTTKLLPYSALKINIYKFLYDSDSSK